MTICLIVITLLGQFCAVDAEPIGDCVSIDNHNMICTIESEQLRIRASYYNPYLCYDGHSINCDSDPTKTSTGYNTSDCFDWCMACPIGWTKSSALGVTESVTIDFGESIGQWTCNDNGGEITVKWGEWYFGEFVEEWVIIVDFMVEQEPFWYLWLLDEWEIE